MHGFSFEALLKAHQTLVFTNLFSMFFGSSSSLPKNWGTAKNRQHFCQESSHHELLGRGPSLQPL